MVSIHVRPPEVDDRVMRGHWEGDFIKGAGNKWSVGVLMERTSRLVLLAKMDDATAVSALAGFSAKLNSIAAPLRQSLPYDRGKEGPVPRIAATRIAGSEIRMNRTILVALLAFTLAAALPLPAAAEDVSWPAKPVRILVPSGTGGVTDIRARWLAERLTPLLGQSVIVENKPGAGGNVGMEMGAHSAPDGYTLTIIHQGVMTVNPHLYSRLGYDPLADLAPITYLGVGPLLLAVHPDVRATTVAELVQLAKAKPGQLSFGSPGIGTPPYLAGELFKRAAGIDTVHIPYKGGGQAVSDLIAGHISYSIEGLTVQLPQVKAGRLRALAVTGPQRVASLPDVPTMAEAGLAGAEFQAWVGIAVPAATPKTVLARLYRDISGILATPEARAWFGEFGADARTDPPDVFAAAIRAEHAKWGKVIREAGIKIE